ncbi:MAG: type II secretion system F family protein [Gammaproteobacteria bacterium]|nr:type II secretion system F family protein [Gammaproteobacteria bacterium]
MPIYRYRAINKSGDAIVGTMEADTPAALERLLRDIGYWLTDSRTTSGGRRDAIKVKVSRRELIDFCSAMAAMLEAGVPVIDAMQTMCKESPNAGFRGVLQDVALNIEGGVSVTEALRAHPGVFNPQLTSIINAGEFSGNLATAFTEVMRYLEWLDGLIADIKQVSIYPAMVLIAVGLFVLLLFSFVVPTFTNLLRQLDIELPLVTLLVMSAGDFARSYWPLLLGTPAACYAAVKLGCRHSPEFAVLVDRFKLSLPVIGEILRMIALSRFSHTMSMLIRSGVPMLQALELSERLVGNRVISRAIANACLAVNEGQTMTSVLRQCDAFTPMILRMMVVGEETGTMDRSLTHVSARFDSEIPRRIKRLFSILEPTITLLLIALVGTVAMSIFLPFMELMGGIL